MNTSYCKMNWIKSFLYTFLLSIGFAAYADLKPIDIKMELSSNRNAYMASEVIAFTIDFENLTDKYNVILLPGSQNKGKKLIYFSYYTVKDNFYTEVARESREINMDTTIDGRVSLRNLKPKASISIPVFLNEKSNYNTHIEAHHALPDLPPGKYQLLAWYDPWDEDYGNQFFNKIESFDKGDEQLFEANKFNIPEEGLISNYFSLEILAENNTIPAFQSTVFCTKNCKYCTAIENEDWSKVAKIIDKQSYYKGKNNIAKTDTNWLQTHRNVAWLYDGPEAILASLPSYTYRRFIFKNANGYHYYNATWQLGIVYPNRSRIKQFFQWAMRVNPPIKGSEVDYRKLILFEKY